MKTRLTHALISLTAILLPAISFAFPPPDANAPQNASGPGCQAGAWRPMPPQLDGTMMPIDFGRWERPAVPDSLRVFFIDRTARHGARFLSSEKKVARLERAVAEARTAGTLTPEGEAFAQLLERVRRKTGSDWGALDSLGVAEQEELARRMLSDWHWPRGAEGRPASLLAEATYVPRVVASMYVFCHTLAQADSWYEVAAAEGRQFSPLLRYFDTDSAYVAYLRDKPWKGALEDFTEGNVSEAPAIRLFGPMAPPKEMRGLTMDLYGVLQSLRATGLGQPTDRWMSEPEYRACWEASNLAHYYQRSSSVFGSVPCEASQVLLDSIVASADRAVASLRAGKPGPAAILRFGHAETILPLLGRMGIEGALAPVATPRKVADVWKDHDLTPLGAELDVVLLEGPSGTVYAWLRLNGRNARVAGLGGPLLPWEALKAHWMR